MKISDLIPNIYANNLEMNSIINSEEIEFEDNLKAGLNGAKADNFINIATIHGIENYEEIFGIIPDLATEDIETRRKRIQERLKGTTPFTENYLKERLDDIIGVNLWEYDINYNDYTLDIYITTPGQTWYNELAVFLASTVPCNVDWTIHIYHTSWQQVKDGFTTWDDLTSYTWSDILLGEWL